MSPSKHVEAVAAERGSAVARRRYRGTDVAVAVEAAGQVRVSSLLDGREESVPASLAALLMRCEGFRTLDEHADALTRSAGLSAERAGAVRRRLESLVDAGWLTPQDELLRRCTAQAAAGPCAASIATLGVPSADRSEVLARGLRSYMRNSRDYGRDVEFVLVDDSRRPDQREANLGHLRALARELGTRACYGGLAEREEYAAELAREAALPPPLVRFGLLNVGGFPWSTGACRNALVLHAVGEPFVFVDDDTVCNLAPAPGARPGLCIAGPHAAMEHDFFATGQEARDAVTFEPRDYFGLYEGVLGHTVAGVLAQAEPRELIDLDRVGPAFVRRLESRPCRIVMATLGVVGDAGLDKTTEMYFFLGDPVSRGRLLAFPGGHRRAFESQQVVRAPTRTTLAETGLCMAIALAVDNRELLPPLMPVMRNEEGVFSHVRRACFPDTAMAFLPWVVEHSPPTPRQSSVEQVLAAAGGARFGDLLSWLIKTSDTPLDERATPEERLAGLGAQLASLAGRPAAEFAAHARDALSKRMEGMTQYVATFEAHCAEAPEQWRQDLQAYLANAKRASASAEGIVPRDLVRAGMDHARALETAQRLVGSYGELLQHWPAMVAAARALRQRGRRLARSVR